MKIKILVATLLLSLAAPAFAQRSDKNAPAALNDGIVYSLPRTGLRIIVKATQERYFRGPYAQFAENLLGIKDAPQTDSENWMITDIRIETFAEPDPAQVYHAKSLNGSMLALSPMGTITGINKFSDWEPAPAPVSNYMQQTAVPAVPFPDLSLDSFFQKKDSTRKDLIIKKSFDQKALEAAETITKLRKRRFKTLANAYDKPLPDGGAYEVMAAELGKLETDYVALFIGKTYSQSFEYSFNYIPGENSVSGDVVFRFSDKKGVLPKTDLSGKPIAIDIKKLDELTSAYGREKSSMTSTPTGNIFYRVPGMGEIRVLNGVSLMAETRATIAQFGTVVALPGELIDGSHQILFNPETGAIKGITSK